MGRNSKRIKKMTERTGRRSGIEKWRRTIRGNVTGQGDEEEGSGQKKRRKRFE